MERLSPAPPADRFAKESRLLRIEYGVVLAGIIAGNLVNLSVLFIGLKESNPLLSIGGGAGLFITTTILREILQRPPSLLIQDKIGREALREGGLRMEEGGRRLEEALSQMGESHRNLLSELDSSDLERPPKTLSQILQDGAFVNEANLRKAEQQAQAEARPLRQVLLEKGLIKQETMATVLAFLYRVPTIDLKFYESASGASSRNLIPEQLALQLQVLPLAIETDKDGKNVLVLAMEDPGEQETITTIADLTGMSVKPYIPLFGMGHAIEEAYHA